MKRYAINSKISLISFVVLCANSYLPSAQGADNLSAEEIVAALKRASTGNIADALDEATGQRGYMYTDMRPLFKSKIVGPAATAILRPILKTDAQSYPNRALEILDEAKPGSVLVYVLEDSLDVSGIGNLSP
jgi:regulator of RNase E activity RraA